MNVRDAERDFGLEVYPRRDLTLVRGRGAVVWDDRGNRFLDCVGGIGVSAVGHANEAVAEAIAQQARTLVTCPGLFYNDRRSELLAKLVALAPARLERAYLCNSGAEAVEAALKLARLKTERTGVVSAMRSFHGRTLGALSATRKRKYGEDFEPLVPGYSFVPFGDAAKLRDAVGDDTAAVLLEPVQGEGGVRPAPEGYLGAARAVCDEAGAMLILDESQTGFCRTGRMFACEHSGVEPDLLCLAKAIAGGVPMGAVLARGDLGRLVGKLGSTFGGNPLACAAALAAIRFMEEEGLAARAEALGARFHDRISRQLPARVRAVRQLGLMIGIELRERCRPYLDGLMARGVLALAAGSTVIRLLPPLVIKEAQVDEVADALLAVLGS